MAAHRLDVAAATAPAMARAGPACATASVAPRSSESSATRESSGAMPMRRQISAPSASSAHTNAAAECAPAWEAARAPGGTTSRRAPSAAIIAASSSASGPEASTAIAHPASPRAATSGSANICSGWKPPIAAPERAAGSSTESSAAPLQCTTPWDDFVQRSSPHTRPIASSGTVRKTRSDASTTVCASPRARLATPAIV
jgi:hypothetical protein